MAGQRKLLSEIDRTLKKVYEGIDVFNDTWNKVYSATQQSQKEKHECDLKKEIKKLQRFREQIKTWLTNNDVKDKRPLMEIRKLIEQKMEDFKICEKETKTKAYSKEGLAQGEKLDPSEKAKQDTRDWIQDCLNQLNDQIDAFDCDLERLGASNIKSKRANRNEMDDLNVLLKRHRWHVMKLEQVTRLLDNNALESSAVDSLKEDIEYYLEANQEANFMETYGEEDIYEALDLDSLLPGAINYVEDGLDENSTNDKNSEIVKPDKNQDPIINDIELSMNSKSDISIIPSPTSSISSTSRNFKGWKNSPISRTIDTEITDEQDKDTTFRSKESIDNPTKKLHSSHTSENTLKNINYSLNPIDVKNPTIDTIHNELINEKLNTTNSNIPEIFPSNGIKKAPLNFNSIHHPNSPSLSLSETNSNSKIKAFNNEFNNTNEQVYKQRTYPVSAGINKEQVDALKKLEKSICYLPKENDLIRNISYIPKNPFNVPKTFPSLPLTYNHKHDHSFDKMDIDTLFFIFYHQPGTYEQYLAAKELKKQTWAYHKKYMTWFKRHEEPKITCDEYEQGTYVYFDYETGWCQRIKTEFTFEYIYLEDELII